MDFYQKLIQLKIVTDFKNINSDLIDFSSLTHRAKSQRDKIYIVVIYMNIRFMIKK